MAVGRLGPDPLLEKIKEAKEMAIEAQEFILAAVILQAQRLVEARDADAA